MSSTQADFRLNTGGARVFVGCLCSEVALDLLLPAWGPHYLAIFKPPSCVSFTGSTVGNSASTAVSETVAEALARIHGMHEQLRRWNVVSLGS